MSSIILHISDLHVSLEKKLTGEVNNHDSYLSTSESKEPSIQFIEKFIATIKRDFSSAKIYLLITGDITNAGEVKEFNFAFEFLTRIITGLEIDQKNVLLIPGDHDLNRRSIENLLAEKENCTEEEINIAKFNNFTVFYNKLLNKVFNPNSIIFDSLVVEDSILLLGLDSCTKINLTEKLGSIPILQLEKEKEAITNFKNLKVIACVHHNFTSAHENKNDGQWDSTNRQLFLDKLLSLGIEYVFTGNEHTNSSKSMLFGEITASDSGCLTSKKYDAAFKVYEISVNDDIILSNRIYSLQKTGGNDSPYDWDKRTNSIFKQPDQYVIFKKQPPVIDTEITEIISDQQQREDLPADAKSEAVSAISPINTYYNPEFSDLLYDKIKELKIFHSGHFHWSETSRAHNWIDISKLIEDKDNLNFTKNAIIDVIEKQQLADKIDLIIGLGYEGNIISTKAAIKFAKPYSFLPYSYRYGEHHKFETELNFANSDNTYRSVLIVTDVVNDGRTIRKLIKKRQDEFFKNVEKIYVVSLLYTGHSVINSDILNYDFIKTIPNYDIENDEQVNNIEYFTVKTLKVEKCPYGKDFRETCLIVKDNLGCVNLFYDESKYIK